MLYLIHVMQVKVLFETIAIASDKDENQLCIIITIIMTKVIGIEVGWKIEDSNLEMLVDVPSVVCYPARRYDWVLHELETDFATQDIGNVSGLKQTNSR